MTLDEQDQACEYEHHLQVRVIFLKETVVAYLAHRSVTLQIFAATVKTGDLILKNFKGKSFYFSWLDGPASTKPYSRVLRSLKKEDTGVRIKQAVSKCP